MVKTGISNPLSFLLDNDIYDADRIENDQDLVRRFYLAHGYPDVRVSSAARYDAGKNGAVVTFKIDEGPQYRFGKVGIESRLKTVDGSALRDNLRTQSGDIYDADAVTADPHLVVRGQASGVADLGRDLIRGHERKAVVRVVGEEDRDDHDQGRDRADHGRRGGK